MRILFVTQWFDPEPGALRGLPLARWLVRRGHEVTVVTGVPNYPGGKIYPGYRMRLWQREEMDGVSVLRVPLYPSHDGSAMGRLLNYGSFAVSAATLGTALAGSADVAYVYHPPATVGLAALVLRAVRRIPYVYHIADMWPESVVESGMLGAGKVRRGVELALSAWCKLIYRQASIITVLSPGFKRLLIERGVPAARIEVVYNWTEEAVFRPLPPDPALAADLGLADRFNVVYAGNLGGFQALECVIRAACRLRDDPRIQIVLVGTGPHEERLQGLARELGATNVRFIGSRPFWEMPQLNSLADVLLVHLRDLPFFAATIPSKTQVALASGRPVLMAVRGDAAALVERAGAGLSCAPENDEAIASAIRQLAAMPPAEREAMGQRGRQYYLEHLSLDVGAGRMEELFARLAPRCGPILAGHGR
jgi:colanic acid biosynthesis glycosyl transferase WcaI